MMMMAGGEGVTKCVWDLENLVTHIKELISDTRTDIAKRQTVVTKIVS